MFKITFKNVGHGDSILLEWKHEKANKIAIIDCNIHKVNPILEYIKVSNYSEIEFIILSHPHYDHFSGMRQLITYCSENNITINKFLHTSYQTPQFLKSAVKSIQAKKELQKLFKEISKLWREKKTIKYQTYVTNDNRELHLTDDIMLKFVSPTTIELDDYIKKSDYFHDEEGVHNNASANLLSTVIKIYNSDWNIVLTSDSVKEVLNYSSSSGIDDSSKLILGQSSHHGSIKNHNNDFWKTIKRKDDCSVIFSVGKNSYNHPSKEVIDFFKNEGYNIEYTNQVGGLTSLENNRDIDDANAILNQFSQRVEQNTENNNSNGDKQFHLNL